MAYVLGFLIVSDKLENKHIFKYNYSDFNDSLTQNIGLDATRTLSGTESWELVGWTLLGVVGGGIVCGDLGAGVGYSVTALAGIKGFFFIGGHVFLIKDTIALGHFGDAVIAGESGFGFYQISTAEYESMTDVQRWTMNSQYLDDCAKLGANLNMKKDILLSYGIEELYPMHM